MPTAQQILESISRGLQMAAQISQEARDPRLGVARDNLARQERRDQEFSQSRRQQLQLSNKREERFAASDGLRTRLQLAAAGTPVSDEQQGILDQGGDVSFQLAPGFAVGQAGGNIIEHGGQSVFVASPAARRQADLSAAIEKAVELEEVRSASRPPPREPSLRFFEDFDESGKKSRVGVHPETGKEVIRTPVGSKPKKPAPQAKAASRTELRAAKKEDTQKKLVAMVGRLNTKYGGDPIKAIEGLEKEAQFDETGFLTANKATIRRMLKGLILPGSAARSGVGGGVDNSVLRDAEELLNNSFGDGPAESLAQPAAPSGAADRDFAAYLKRRGGG